MAGFFAHRAHPSAVVNRALKRATTVAWQQVLRSDSSSPSEQHPSCPPIPSGKQRESQKHKNKNWDLLKSDCDTRDVFQSTKILCAYRRDSNSRDSLVRSSLSTTESRDEETRTLPCGRPRCFTCPHTNASRTMKTAVGQLTMQHRYTCRTSNSVYNTAYQRRTFANIYDR